MAQALQHDPTALIPELPTTGTANISTGNVPSGSERGDAVVSIPLVQNIRQVTRQPVRTETACIFWSVRTAASYGGYDTALPESKTC